MRIMTWNAEGILCSGRELEANNVDVMIVTETEIPVDPHHDFNMVGYTSFLPHTSSLLKTAKYRVVPMVWTALATSASGSS
jgi:hypothetical protein